MLLLKLSFCLLLSFMLTLSAAQTMIHCQNNHVCFISDTHWKAGQPLVWPTGTAIKIASKIVFMNSTLDSLPKEIFEIAPKVQQVVVNGCSVKEIGFAFIGSSQLQYLQKLFVGGNEITTLTAGQFENTVAMTDLDLSGNQIDKIDAQAFRSLKKLKDLNLGSNRLKYLMPGVFKDLPNLNYLYLNDNLFSELKLREWGVAYALTRLFVGGNRMEVITANTFAGYQKIQKLDLSNNGITKLDEEVMVPLRSLRFINLSGNKLRTLNQLRFGSRLNYLYLNSSEIETINFDLFNVGVANVALQSNEIVHITASKVNFHTKNLNLAGNQIQHFPGNLQFQQLTDLALSNNPKLQWQPTMLWGFKGLKSLHLEATNLTASILEMGALSNQLDLLNLDLSFNDLRRLNLQALDVLPVLTDLTFSNANLTELVGYESIKKTFPDLSFIDISGNLWNCSYLDTMISTFFKMSVSLNGQDVVGNGRPHINNIVCNRTNDHMVTTEMPTMPTTVPSTLELTTMMEKRTYIKALEEITTMEKEVLTVTTEQPIETTIVPEKSKKESRTEEVTTDQPSETTLVPDKSKMESGSEEVTTDQPSETTIVPDKSKKESRSEEVTTDQPSETTVVPEVSQEDIGPEEWTTVLVTTENSGVLVTSNEDSRSGESDDLGGPLIIQPNFELGSYINSNKENDSSNQEKELQTGLVVVSMPLIWTVLAILAIVTVVLVIFIYIVMCSNIVLAHKKTYIVKEPPGIHMEMITPVDDYIDDF